MNVLALQPSTLHRQTTPLLLLLYLKSYVINGNGTHTEFAAEQHGVWRPLLDSGPLYSILRELRECDCSFGNWNGPQWCQLHFQNFKISAWHSHFLRAHPTRWPFCPSEEHAQLNWWSTYPAKFQGSRRPMGAYSLFWQRRQR